MRAAALVATAVLGAAFLAGGCEGGRAATPGQLRLSWSFADGRGCSEATVPFVYVGPPGGATFTRLDCFAGLGQTVDAGRFPPGPLLIEATSVAGAPLYRARATMPASDPATLAVVLTFVGGAP